MSTIVVDAPDFVSASDLQIRLGTFSPSVRFSGGSYQVVVQTRRPVARLLPQPQSWVDCFCLDDAAVLVDEKPYLLHARSLAWGDLEVEFPRPGAEVAPPR